MDETFDGLVQNALEFLERSVGDLEAGALKYAVINFYSGVELFFKARLYKEHWALVVKDPGTVSMESVKAGDFESVGLETATKRLQNITGCSVNTREAAAYDVLRRQRNQAVHFFHPDLGSGKRIAVQQLIGWNYLYNRLMIEWQDHFGDPNFRRKLRWLQGVLAKRQDFYPAIYEEVKTDLEKLGNGSPISACLRCMQVSGVVRGRENSPVYRTMCLVCSDESFAVFLPCGGCQKLAPRQFGRDNICRHCSHPNLPIIGEVAKLLKKEASTWCGGCGYTAEQSVFDLGEGTLCWACHHFEPEGDGCCGWCASQVTGSIGDDRSPGCVRCEHFICYAEQGEVPPVYLYDPAELWAPESTVNKRMMTARRFRGVGN